MSRFGVKQSVFPEFEEKFFEEDNQYGAGSFMYRAYGKVTFRCYNLNMIITKNNSLKQLVGENFSNGQLVTCLEAHGYVSYVNCLSADS